MVCIWSVQTNVAIVRRNFFLANYFRSTFLPLTLDVPGSDLSQESAFPYRGFS
jgi:hypothetical protein